MWENGSLFPDSVNEIYEGADNLYGNSLCVHVLRESQMERAGRSVSLILISEPLSYVGCEWHAANASHKVMKGDTSPDAVASSSLDNGSSHDVDKVGAARGLTEDAEVVGSARTDPDAYALSSKSDDRGDTASFGFDGRGDPVGVGAVGSLGIARSSMHGSVADNAPAALT